MGKQRGELEKSPESFCYPLWFSRASPPFSFMQRWPEQNQYPSSKIKRNKRENRMTQDILSWCLVWGDIYVLQNQRCQLPQPHWLGRTCPDFKDSVCRMQCILSRKQVARLWSPSGNTTTDFLQPLFLYIYEGWEVKREMLSLLKTVQILVGALEELVYSYEAILSAGKLTA